MQIIRSIKKMQSLSRGWAYQGKSIAVVPTMGFLHEGHVSLITKAKAKADIVIVTIFVNPAQFAPGEDLDIYPQDEKEDVRKIKAAGAQAVFIPKPEQVYPLGFETYVNVEKLSTVLEGAARPTHFRGVTTIVAKLFNIVRPDYAVFGMKDFQQAMVLKRMVTDLDYPIRMIIAPTVRESDGLAMSSRNKYFTSSQRPSAVGLYHALRTAKAMTRAGISSTTRIKKEMEAVIASSCPGASIEYISFNNMTTLRPVKKIMPGVVVCSLAVNLYGVRLIDNMKLA